MILLVTCNPLPTPPASPCSSARLAPQVHYQSNRLGVRLVGPKPEWVRPDGGEGGTHPSNVHDHIYAIGAVNFTGGSFRSPSSCTHNTAR